MPASRMTRITPLTAGFPMKAVTNGRPRARASAATSTRNNIILIRKRREWFMPQSRSGRAGLSPAAQRLLDQRGERQVQMIVGGEHVPRRHHVVAARHVADITAGFADQQNARRDVPWREAKLPEPVKAAGRDIGEIESRRAH